MKASRKGTDDVVMLMLDMGRIMRKAMLVDGTASLSFSSLETLHSIAQEEGTTMREVADRLKIAAPSATALVEHLVEEGLITRTVDTKDRRVVRLALSAKGKRLFKSIKERRLQVLRWITKPLSVRDRKELARILSIIITSAHGK